MSTNDSTALLPLLGGNEPSNLRNTPAQQQIPMSHLRNGELSDEHGNSDPDANQEVQSEFCQQMYMEETKCEYAYNIKDQCRYHDKFLYQGYVSGEAHLPSLDSEYKLLNTFEFIKAVSETVLDKINAVNITSL